DTQALERMHKEAMEAEVELAADEDPNEPA
ncbi:MAG: hypothetical protein QOD43_1017, partial [Gaiellaceae bacterium]|nr:hypothetical protein [Gaiellaceae bacterium]